MESESPSQSSHSVDILVSRHLDDTPNVPSLCQLQWLALRMCCVFPPGELDDEFWRLGTLDFSRIASRTRSNKIFGDSDRHFIKVQLIILVFIRVCQRNVASEPITPAGSGLPDAELEWSVANKNDLRLKLGEPGGKRRLRRLIVGKVSTQDQVLSSKYLV